VDTNKYTNWNALMISACAEAGTLLEREDARAAALRAMDVLISDAYEDEHGFYHNFHTDTGARLPGFFEDQIYTVQALLDGYTLSGNQGYLQTARHTLELCLTQYWDEERGGFFDMAHTCPVARQTEFLDQPRKVIEDMPTPASNAVAALVLDRAWLLTHEERYHAYARRTLEAFAGHAPDYGPFAATYGLALHYHLQPAATVAIVGKADDERTRALLQAALASYRPGRMVLRFSPDEEGLPYPAGSDGQPVAYVCAGESCSAPTSEAATLVEELQRFGVQRQEDE
jgi:uncharacterized protein YyaL (SSP411 family)